MKFILDQIKSARIKLAEKEFIKADKQLSAIETYIEEDVSSQLEPQVMQKQPIAWACKTCGKIDWADSKEQKAQPEHISYRGIDLGECKGKMIPLFSA